MVDWRRSVVASARCGAPLRARVAELVWQAAGRYPGDIRIESERSRTFIPITSMIILSVLLTILLNLFRR
nr:DUF2905 domain-containing protein [Pseudomonas sp. MT4]